MVQIPAFRTIRFPQPRATNSSGSKSACPLADPSGRGSLDADRNLLTCLSLQQFNFKHAIAERRVDLVWVNGAGQIQNEEDLISLPFGIHGLSLPALRSFLALATDKKAARLNSYLKVPLPEPRHLGTNGKLGFRLSDIHLTAAQDFRLSAKPVLQLLAMGKSSGLRQFIGTTRDQLLDLLHALEERVACKKFEDFWCAKKFCCGFHPGFLLSRESVLCQLRRTHPFGSQPCAAMGFFHSPSRRLRFLCGRVERSGANCSMNPQIRVPRHTRTARRAAS